MSTQTTTDLTSATVEVTMPATGSDAAVVVAAWLKHPGEAVDDHEAICVVDFDGDKAEVVAPAPGVLRMVTVASGQHVAVGATLAVIDVAVAQAGDFSLGGARG